ncbi:Xyloglucan endo-transglycosylase, C-terminal [Sesbania bispinosa]|nr:Xyloglucan endo-transglycosylase, C-terminal [Sesbania bispinosa]
MAICETYLRDSAVLVASLLMCLFGVIAEGDFDKDIDITWGDHRAKILGSNVLVLSLDQSSGSGFQSKTEYLFGRIDMQLKLVSDNIPIRVFNNYEARGVPFPSNQPMRLYSSLWCADQWATRGGFVKTNWSFAPFRAHYRNFDAKACLWSKGSSSCPSSSATMSDNTWQVQSLNANDRRSLRWVQKYYMIYDYCKDYKRFPQGRPRECRLSRFY